jgi:hypothetical protein
MSLSLFPLCRFESESRLDAGTDMECRGMPFYAEEVSWDACASSENQPSSVHFEKREVTLRLLVLCDALTSRLSAGMSSITPS